jgi:hypothetical protein
MLGHFSTVVCRKSKNNSPIIIFINGERQNPAFSPLPFQLCNFANSMPITLHITRRVVAATLLPPTPDNIRT